MDLLKGTVTKLERAETPQKHNMHTKVITEVWMITGAKERK